MLSRWRMRTRFPLIYAVRAEQGAAVVVVSLNWGTSGTSKPTNAQRKLAQAIADAGADVIVGAGTRVVQPVTWLTHKNADGTAAQTLCAWSLGSLLNESRKDGNVAGMLLQLQISWDWAEHQLWASQLYADVHLAAEGGMARISIG